MKYFLVFLCSFCVLCQICIGGDDSSSQEEGSDNSLKDLQKNVSSLWTYVSGMRQKVEHDLHQLHQHQVEVSNKLKSMFGIELEHGDGHMHHMDQEQHRDDHSHEGHHHDDNHSREHHDSHHDGHYDDHHHDEHSSEHQHGNAHHHHQDDHHDDHHSDHHDDHHSDHHNDHHSDHHNDHHSDHHDDHRGEDHHHDNHGHDGHHHHPSHDDHDQGHNDSAHSHTSDNHQHEHGSDDDHHTHAGHTDDHHTHAGHMDDHHTHAGHTDDHHTNAGHTDDHHAHAGHTDEGHDHSEDNDTSHSSESHHHHQESHHRSHHHHQEHEAHHHHRYSHHHSHHDLHAQSSKYEFAVCDVEPNTAIPLEKQQNVTGRINLWQQKNGTTLNIHIKVKGFKMDGHDDHGDQETGQGHHPTQHVHGFHVHQEGDLSDSCQSTGPHFNPTGVQHGGPSSAIRHLGDLGNIYCDKHGVTNLMLRDQIASLHGENSIIGKSMVIHERKDDLGTNPDNPASLSSGDAGTRIACCVIRSVERLSRGHSHGHHGH